MENYVNSLNLGFLICKRNCWEDEIRGQVKFREELAHRKCSKDVHCCWVGGIIPLLFETIFLISEGNSQQHSCSGLFFTKELSIWSGSWWQPTSWLSGKESSCNSGVSGDVGSIPGLEDPLEEGMATHSSILAWRIPWTEILLQFRSLRRCGFDPWVGRSPGGEHGNPLQYSCLENPMDRGAWRAIVHRVSKSRTPLKRLSTHTHSCSGCLTSSVDESQPVETLSYFSFKPKPMLSDTFSK